MKDNIKKTFAIVFMLAIGAAFGAGIATIVIDALGEERGAGEYFFMLALYVLLLYAVYFIHIIVHESGHLVFGLLTGYKFNSFRIGSVIMTKENGKIRFSRFSLMGTAGQCLLSPPEEKEGKIPFKLYNLGGVIFNLLLAALSLALYFVLPKAPTLSVLLLGSVVIGLFCAFTNGVPMNGVVNNDGSNAVALGKDIHARRSFAKQLSVNARMAQGERLCNMPTELFELGDGADTRNPINNTITVFKCNRLLDEHRFAEARELCEKLISDETVMPIYKNMLICDLAFCEMLAGETERAKSRFTKAQNKFITAMAKNPSIIRTRYAYALLCEKNAVDAGKYRTDFEKAAESYPYSGDIESERELMAEAKKAVEK